MCVWGGGGGGGGRGCWIEILMKERINKKQKCDLSKMASSMKYLEKYFQNVKS